MALKSMLYEKVKKKQQLEENFYDKKFIYLYILSYKVKFTHDKNKTIQFTKTHMTQEKIIFPQGTRNMISPRI